jgi:hypothetical protein
MNDQIPIPYQSNPETRGTGPVEFFEDTSGDPPPGAMATPRPTERPRVLPPAEALPADGSGLAHRPGPAPQEMRDESRPV